MTDLEKVAIDIAYNILDSQDPRKYIGGGFDEEEKEIICDIYEALIVRPDL